MKWYEKAEPFLKEGLSLGVALKGLTKLDPRIQAFVYAATTAGFGADKIMEYIRESAPEHKRATRGRLESRRQSGSARPDELARLDQYDRSAGPQTLVKRAAQLGAGLSAAAATPAPAGEEEVTDTVTEDISQKPKPQNWGYFERAMEGIRYQDLTPEMRQQVGKIRQRLNDLEQNKVPWEDPSVQKIVKGVRRLIKREDFAGQELTRMEQGSIQAGASSDAKAQFLQALQALRSLTQGG